VPPLPCLRPYHAKINLIWMEECDLANTARIFQSRSSEQTRTSGLIPHKSLANDLASMHLPPSRNRASKRALKKESSDHSVHLSGPLTNPKISSDI
jgi:hypothetical protein